MKIQTACMYGAAFWLLNPYGASAQAPPPNPVQRMEQAAEATRTGPDVPLYSVTVVGRTTHAVNYRHRGGATKIDFEGTPLLPKANGEAKVESKQGYIEIEVEFDELEPASKYGREYLTYVMWAITPEGRAQNLGEVILNGNRSKLNVTTDLQAFGMIITAEPYFGVTQPSDVVVMENVIRKDTMGATTVVDAKYDLLKRGQYTMNVDPSKIQTWQPDERVPLELYQARNAMQLARFAGADQWSGDTFAKATELLARSEDYLARKQSKKSIAMVAREAVQTAEDSRLIAVQRQEAERIAREKRMKDEQARLAQARADAESRARAEAEVAAAQAAAQKADADRARQAALDEQRRAEAMRRDAEAKASQAQALAADAQRQAREAELERQKLRAELREQLNAVLETRESARGLIVNMSDVLFDFGKHTLKPGAREKLAKISGILATHKGLNLEIEGHTDSVGSDEFNQELSEKRAEAVRLYLASQGVASDHLVARGFGESRPVASNDNDAGRQQNRRVEIVVSGDIISKTVRTTTTVSKVQEER